MSIFLFILFLLLTVYNIDGYLIGTGKADITGPVAEIHLFGYAEMNQIGNGILQRCFARSYIIVDDDDHQGEEPMVKSAVQRRLVFVNVDLQSMSLSVKFRVVERLQSIFGPDLYTMENVMISSTHTHSAVGGFLEYTLYEIPVKGWIEETVQPIVSGITKSIVKAHHHLEKGNVTLHSGELFDTNINRSPAAYNLNPQHERNLYTSNVDKTMTLLGFYTEKQDLGLINWFAVHGVSVNKTNRLVNGDNKGYGSYWVEKNRLFSNSSTSTSSDKFVAAFAQSNEGDVSPHTLGSFCTGTNIPCDGTKMTKCPWFSTCQGRGPGWTVGHLESNRMIGENQARMATRLYLEAKGKYQYVLNGPVDFRQVYWNVPHTKMIQPNGSIHSLCAPAMGLAFIGGTTDAEPGLGVYQSTTHMPWYWKFVRAFIKTPSQSQVECHAPKPILFDTGEMSFPHAWQPNVLDIQLFRVGNTFIAAVPAEFTTMSGRRLRKAIADTLMDYGVNTASIILSGPANGYSSYVATFEEYQMQRFEGAATAYGPHTLEGYIQVFQALVRSMMTEQPIQIPSTMISSSGNISPLTTIFDPTTMMMNPKRLAFDFTPKRTSDRPLLSFHFGDILKDTSSQRYYPTTSEIIVISASFVAGNPRHYPMLDGTFLTVEKKQQDGTWEIIRNDHDYDTRFRWNLKSKLFGQSEAIIEWEINNKTEHGTFRLGYFGHHKEFISRMIKSHHGYSQEFTIGDSI
ncbi:Neutral/alkaline nonlysosomal ceramidase [Halteromyces radiatus]|uniref:Neutral/alkaline nonlysosomal ceramidase n=1 Tax=Halteromyces radiatus TaxID=101107 RepID=UPI00221FDB1B|nr:Neutral/alkaline nonlysosomal ceramidase [Halteromyces radiatus]KAI8077818.1 Neutral/alkaline nonlysosomal ceramidase [Halteromyces radiatus]